MDHVTVALVSVGPKAAAARATSRAALLLGCAVEVLDLDGAYRPVGTERVRTIEHLGLARDVVHRRALTDGPAALARSVLADLVARVLADADADATVLALDPGIELVGHPGRLVEAARRHGVAAVARSARALPPDGRWPDDADVSAAGGHHPGLLALHHPDPALLDTWRAGGRRPDDRWLDLALSRVDHVSLSAPELLVSPWSLAAGDSLTADASGTLLLDGRPVVAVDLSHLDARVPWLLAAEVPREPRARLSDHPVLAAMCAAAAGRLLSDAPVAPATALEISSLGFRLDDVVRELYRDAERSGTRQPPPDPFDPASAGRLADWLADPAPDGGPGRYLRAVHRSRPDLVTAFPGVPGDHTAAFLEWADQSGRHEPRYSTALVDLCLSRIPPRPVPVARRRRPFGVNVVGYLTGGLGIGESARLMRAALEAADIPSTTVAVDQHLASAQGTAFTPGTATEPLDTTLLCVNADLTPTVAAAVPRLLSGGYRVGMWYWEVESFPAGPAAAAAELLDEVWVATDFIRQALLPHVDIPVRTVTPPLPQAGRTPAIGRGALGLPDRPVFLFAFDYLSTAERKNPLGLADAFARAFAPTDGPVLVLKTINADQRPGDAERLRLAVAGMPHVLLLEGFWPAAERDALMAHCDVYVSLHRAEGLGLTMAEAMAWGKPVIATAYSGNLQFMTQENSFLVPWSTAPVPPGADPYPAGTPWAEPDLDEAARLMRLVMTDPELAARRGARAALDIRTLHSPEVAGRRVREALDTLHRARPRQRRQPLEALARRVAGRIRS